MGYYTVEQGDCLTSIAHANGLADYRIIYERPENADLRRTRPNPNIVCPGDVLFIPEVEIKQVPKGTGQRHVFEIKQPRVQLRLCLKDDFDQPYKNTSYHLRVGLNEWDGSTDGAGMLEQDIEADATEGVVTILPHDGNRPDQGYTLPLQLGNLDPINEMSGVDARLLNLGFWPPDAKQTPSDGRSKALKTFQKRFGLDVTGELTDETRSRLRELHDGE